MEESVYLPLELILEILLRLPVKTLLRFRCVCKSWFSLFSNNSFATSHFQLAAATRRLAFINRCGSKLLSIDVDAWLRDDFGYALLTDDFVHPIDDVRIIGSCRGFLVLHSDAYFYIWNPSTRLIKQIPQYPITFSAPNFLYGFPDNVLFGFGYDQSTDDYFIVSWFFKGYRIATSTEFLIFSLRANNWKPIEVPSHFPYMITAEWGNNPRGGLFLNDSIHWVVYNDETSKNVIVALDLKEMTISEIALPDDSSREYVLLVVGGLINAWMKNQNTVKIWVMQQYAVHSSWTKTIEFSVDPVLHNSLSILCITSCGVIIGKDGEGRLVKFNDKGDLLEHPFFYNHSDISEFVVYTESLYLLPDTNTSQV